MKVLLQYLKHSKKPLILALVLAAVNQSFSLVDPMITGQMFQKLAVNHGNYTGHGDQFVKFILTPLFFDGFFR